MPKVLIIYYSRTGHTKRVAEKLASLMGADIERVEEESGGPSRFGFFGYMFAGYQGVRRKHTPVRSLTKDVATYDLVIVGTPIWAGNMSAPVRTCLGGLKGKVKACALFCTMGGSGGKRAFAQMTEILGTAPKATMEINEGELKGTVWFDEAGRFAGQLTAGQSAANNR